MRWIALTGVNGFIGHNLLCEFLEGTRQTLDANPEFVLGCDLPGSLERATHRRASRFSNYLFTTAGNFLEELASLQRKFGTPPVALIHNGACSSTTETDREVFRKLNVESSQQLFDYCTRNGVPFIYASSASVYGDGSLGFSDLPEKNAQYTPLNLYGRSKHQFDSWVLEQKEKPPIWFGLRYFNVFGPFEEHKGSQASVLHWGRDQIEAHGKIKLYRSHREDIVDGEQRRDFVCVFDVVRVTLELLKLSLTKPDFHHRGLFVNIGRGQAATWLETAQALFESLNETPQIEFVDMPGQLQEHYQNFTEADLTTLRQLGITQPFLGLREGFQRSLERMAGAVQIP